MPVSQKAKSVSQNTKSATTKTSISQKTTPVKTTTKTNISQKTTSPKTTTTTTKKSPKIKSVKTTKTKDVINRVQSPKSSVVNDGSTVLQIKTGKKILKDAPDQFFNDGHREIDFILVYKQNDTAKQKQRELFHNSLIERKLELEIDTSETKEGRKFSFVKIHAPCEVLATMAEVYRLKIPFNDDRHPEPMPKTWFEQYFGIKWFSLSELYLRKFELRHNYYARFTAAHADLFVPYNENSFFEPRHRIEFVWEILCETEYVTNDDKCETKTAAGIERLLKEEVYLAAYPIHDGGKCSNCKKETDQPITDWNTRRLLHRYWSKLQNFFKHQPIVQIERYYGLTVAFYFAWLGCYTRALIPAAVVGVLSFLYGISSFSVDETVIDVCKIDAELWMCPYCFHCMPWRLGDSCFLYQMTAVLANKGMVIYAVFICFWSAWFLIYWQRKEAELKWDWQDTSISTVQDRIRYEYAEKANKVKIQNPITHKLEPYVDESYLLIRKLFSGVVTFLVILGLLFVMAILLTIRIHVVNLFHETGLKKQIEERIGRIDRIIAAVVCGILSAIVIVIAEVFYEKLARKLTDWECPRTMLDYEKSFIYKTVIFEIFNYFGTLIYLAVFKGNFFHGPVLKSKTEVFGTEYCYPGGCMTELTVEVIIRIVFIQWIHSVWEFTRPLALKKLRKRKKFAWKSKFVKQWEKDFALVPPPELFITEEYEEMVLQYGLVCLFSAAFPLTPLLTLLNNLVEIRCDARKWTQIYRRPVPQIATSIGPWYKIIVAISLLSIVFNGVIVVFTSELVQQYVYISSHGGLVNYTMNQLSEFDLTNFTYSDDYNPGRYSNSCYFGTYRESTWPYGHTITGMKMMMYKWMFFSLFLIVVTFGRSLITTFSRSVPKTLDIQMRREQYLARQVFMDVDSYQRTQNARKMSSKSKKEK